MLASIFAGAMFWTTSRSNAKLARRVGAKMRRMNARILEKEALGLPPDKRAKLAQRLLQSLDELSEAEAEKLWLEEALQRAREIDAGKVSLVTQELERRVRARIK